MSVIALHDDLTFATVAELSTHIHEMLETGGDHCVVDLAQVHRADSAGLAFLLELMRHADSHGQSIRFQNIPKQFVRLATFCGVDNLLPINGEHING